MALGRRMCRQHAAPLVAMAAFILDDVNAAGSIVVDTIAAACWSRTADLRGDVLRATLAASVFRRCLGNLVNRERFGPVGHMPGSTASSQPGGYLASLSATQRCTIAVILFSGHSLQAASRTGALPSPRVSRHPR
jgi:hypothetical protein